MGPSRRQRQRYSTVREAMVELLSRDDLRRINRLGLWSFFASLDQVKQFAAQPRAQRLALFARFEAQLGATSTPPVDSDHALFDLPQSASVHQITARYRELAMAFHPDRKGDHELMQQINLAYRRLLEGAGADTQADAPPGG